MNDRQADQAWVEQTRAENTARAESRVMGHCFICSGVAECPTPETCIPLGFAEGEPTIEGVEA